MGCLRRNGPFFPELPASRILRKTSLHLIPFDVSPDSQIPDFVLLYEARPLRGNHRLSPTPPCLLPYPRRPPRHCPASFQGVVVDPPDAVRF